MALTANQKSNIISLRRQLDAETETIFDKIIALNARYVAANGSAFVDGDFVGDNVGVPAADFQATQANYQTLISSWTAMRANFEKTRV